MNRFKIEGIFILILAVITAILFWFVQMDKLSYYDMDSNYVYSGILYLVIGCLIAFNYYVLDYAIWLNIIVTLVFTIVARYTSHFLVTLLVNKIRPVDLYELFQYKWLSLLFVGITMVLLTEALIWIRSDKTRIK